MAQQRFAEKQLIKELLAQNGSTSPGAPTVRVESV